MPRANRYIKSGYVYHLTHRCHDQEFLLGFAVDREEYCRRLRAAVREFRISLLNYCVTSNHAHHLVAAKATGEISRFMQTMEGEFAGFYNRRKGRSGAYWGERYHCTMVESGSHLWNCLSYIDLNMVRAGSVKHPRDWRWCGYHEIAALRQRYRILDLERLMDLLDIRDPRALAERHDAAIAQDIEQQRLNREPMWTESIAVGSEWYIKGIAGQIKGYPRLTVREKGDGVFYLREATVRYRVCRRPHSGVRETGNRALMSPKRLD